MGLLPLEQKRLEFCISKAADKTRPTQQHHALPFITEARALTSQLDPGDVRISYLNKLAATCQSIGLHELSCDFLGQVLHEIEQITQIQGDNEWGTSEDIVWQIQVSGFLEAGETFLNLRQQERGLLLIDQSLAIQKLHKDDDDLDGYFITLNEIAYLYGVAGLTDKALSIAFETDEYHATFRFFIPMSWYCLNHNAHAQLLRLLPAAEWTGLQGWLAAEITKYCHETKQDLGYVRKLMTEIHQITAKAHLLLNLASLSFQQKQSESALSDLEHADDLILLIEEPQLRQIMRDAVEECLALYI